MQINRRLTAMMERCISTVHKACFGVMISTIKAKAGNQRAIKILEMIKKANE